MAAPLPSEAVPLNVWPCAQTPLRRQWSEAGYAPGSAHYAAALAPDMARRIVGAFSATDDLVVEPLAGCGVVAVEAAGLRRRAVAVSPTAAMAGLVTANASRVLARGNGAHRVTALVGDAEAIGEVLPGSARAAALVVASLPRRRPDAPSLRWDLSAILAGCRDLLLPGGFLVVASRAGYNGRAFINDSAGTVAAAETTGLDYFQHIVALTATLRGGELIATGRALARGDRHVVTHVDLLVFRAPGDARP